MFWLFGVWLQKHCTQAFRNISGSNWKHNRQLSMCQTNSRDHIQLRLQEPRNDNTDKSQSVASLFRPKNCNPENIQH